MRQTAIGINFSDVNVRRGGFYIGAAAAVSADLGNEAAGVVESVGRGRHRRSPGDRVAYAGMRGEFFEDTGAYAEARNVPAERLIKLPEGVSDRQAAAMMVKGFTASLIVNRVYRPKPGDTILIHGVRAASACALRNGRSISAPRSSARSARRRRRDRAGAWLRPHDPLSRN